MTLRTDSEACVPYQIRGRGLMSAVEIAETKELTAWDFCLKLKERGVLAKPTHQNIIRFTPPLVITEEQIDHVVDVFQTTLRTYATAQRRNV